MLIERHPSRRPEIRLLEIAALKAHEKIIPGRMRRIKSDIQRSGKLKMPLWVEKDHLVVLNGHHRLAALKELGCQFAPAIVLDYEMLEVSVCPGSKIRSIDKRAVIAAALSQNLFPPRSSLHAIRLKVRAVLTPLEMLGQNV